MTAMHSFMSFVSTTFVLSTLLGFGAAAPSTSLDLRAADAPYNVPEDQLAAALECPDGFNFPKGKPTLLVPGTAEVASQAFGAGYFTQLKQDGYEPCYVNINNVSLGDAQITSEYVAYNIRQLYNKARKQQIRVVAHSQGNMNTQWALLFWPSTRPMVKNFVSVAGGFKGTVAGPIVCTAEKILRGGCTVSLLQQSSGSNFVKVLSKNADRDLVPMTSIYTLTDDIIQPEFPEDKATSFIGQGNAYNVAIQSLCAGHVADHFTMLVDPVAYALALDALNNNGIADADRVKKNNPNLCTTIKPIGADTSDSIVTAMRNVFNDLTAIFGHAEPLAKEEPALASYAAAVA